jgi:elongation of very long chain fatty acids protein 4
MHTRDYKTGKSLPIWWKSYLTLLQLFQFVTMMSQGTYLLTSGCDQLSAPLARVYVGYIFSLFLLFSQFYVKSYMQPKKKKTA